MIRSATFVMKCKKKRTHDESWIVKQKERKKVHSSIYHEILVNILICIRKEDCRAYER